MIFPETVLEAAPYKINIILTDNGIQFAGRPRTRNTIYSRKSRFDMICDANEDGTLSPEEMTAGIQSELKTYDTGANGTCRWTNSR